MIGLEYIAKTFQVEFKTIAERLGISPKTVNDWVKCRKKIPIKRLNQLANIFELKEEYFQKELSRVDELEIQKENVLQHSQTVEREETGVDDLGEEYSVVTSVNDSEGLLQILSQEQERSSLLSKIDKIVHTDDGQPYNLDLFKDFIGLVKDDKRLVSLLIGSLSPYIGIAPYVGSPTEKEEVFTEELEELLKRFGYLVK